jgi:N-acetylmuramoyl-L-alanine amidase
MKICIDAGHYGNYNRCPAIPEYWESKFTWKFHLLLKAQLEQYGATVVTTRADQTKDLSLTARGKKAAGCDLFLSIHSNALGSGGMVEGTDYPLACCTVTHKADALGDKLAATVARVMQTRQQGRRINKVSSGGADWYGVLRGAASVGVPAILLEHGFHTDSRCVRWLLDDENLAKLAAAEAQTIAEHYGLCKQTHSEIAQTAPETAFLVRVAVAELNVRKGAGVEFPVTTRIYKGYVFTIVETANAKDGGLWGKLKSGAGWINISPAYVKRM